MGATCPIVHERFADDCILRGVLLMHKRGFAASIIEFVRLQNHAALSLTRTMANYARDYSV